MAYTEKDHAAAHADKDFIDTIKSNHFSLGHDPKGSYVTTFQASYKDTEGAELSQLDQDRKKDLRASHFNVGNPANS